MSERTPLGLSVAVFVEPLSGHRKFMSQFQDRQLRDDIVKGNLHVAVQYPEELIATGLSVEEQTRLSRAGAEILVKLADLSLVGSEFEVDVDKGVSNRKKWWTIGVDSDYEGLFSQCRKVASSVVAEVLPPIRLAEYSPEGYGISLTKSTRGHDRLRTKIPPPALWRVSGFGVDVRSAVHEVNRSTSYLNRSSRGTR